MPFPHVSKSVPAFASHVSPPRYSKLWQCWHNCVHELCPAADSVHPSADRTIQRWCSFRRCWSGFLLSFSIYQWIGWNKQKLGKIAKSESGAFLLLRRLMYKGSLSKIHMILCGVTGIFNRSIAQMSTKCRLCDKAVFIVQQWHTQTHRVIKALVSICRLIHCVFAIKLLGHAGV